MTSVRASRLLVAALIAGAVVVASLAPVMAHTATTNDKIELKKEGEKGLKGKVESKDPTKGKEHDKDLEKQCKNNRQVDLYRRQTGGDVLVGSTFTNDHGEYKFGPQTAGTYYTRIELKPLGAYGHTHTCGAAQSKDVVLKKDQKG